MDVCFREGDTFLLYNKVLLLLWFETHYKNCNNRFGGEGLGRDKVPFTFYNNNNIYLLQLGCYPVAVVILHVNKHEIGYY